MSGRLVVLALLLAAAATPAWSQVRATASATTRLLDPRRGTTAPAIWLGLGLEADQERWGGRLGVAGAAGDEAWAGEALLDVRAEGRLAGAVFLLGRGAGVVEWQRRGLPDREVSGRLGLRLGSGPVRLEIGALGVTGSLTGTAGAGGFAGARVTLGQVLLQGEFGQLTTLTGSSLASPVAGDGLTSVPDTAIKRNAARRLGHGIVGGTWSRDWLRVTGRVIRRSRLAPDDRMGWELGVGITPVAGVRFDVMAARAPVGPSIYLPFRRQLTVGVSLAERRPRRPDRGPAADVTLPAGFEVLSRGAGLARIRLRLPGATRVELVADFTDWTPVALARVGPGVFETDLPVPSGIHLVNVRVDGGPLQIPPGLEGTDDGFGGRAGILVVR